MICGLWRKSEVSGFRFYLLYRDWSCKTRVGPEKKIVFKKIHRLKLKNNRNKKQKERKEEEDCQHCHIILLLPSRLLPCRFSCLGVPEQITREKEKGRKRFYNHR
jgi:hypothetical protein